MPSRQCRDIFRGVKWKEEKRQRGHGIKMAVAITSRIARLIKFMKEKYEFLLFSLRSLLAVITKAESQQPGLRPE